MEDLASHRLFELASCLTTERSLPHLLDRVLDALIAVSAAERGFIILLEDGQPRVRLARPPEDGRRVSWSILGRVLSDNRPLVLADALRDPQLGTARSVQREGIRSVCALPLRTPGHAVGAIYLDHRASAGAFSPALLKTLHAFAGLAAVAIRNLQTHRPPAEIPNPEPLRDLVAVAPAMKRVVATVLRFAHLPYPVYIHGESGTGKELVARAIHQAGSRGRGPFVPANAAAISGTIAESELFGHSRGAFTGADRPHAGLFEQAHGGTLFLDEIEAMPLSLQEKLLRVLQDGEVRPVGAAAPIRVDVRIVSASNEDVERMNGRFRRDLLYRLNVLRLDLPPLRERPDDLPALVEHLLARIERETGREPHSLMPETLARLSGYDWPGNVRELENALRRACAMAGTRLLTPEDFAFLQRQDRDLPDPLEPLALDEHVRRAVKQFGACMTLSDLAKRLGISRKTLWKKRKGWGMI